MAYKVKFGDTYLSDYCSVLNVKRSVLPTRSNFSKQIPTMNGSYYTGSKYEEKIITLEVAIYAKDKYEYAEKVSYLSEILNVKSPRQLIIDDEPYKAYYAVVDGSTDLNKTFNNGLVNINLICHDPIAESLYWNTYAPTGNTFQVISYGNEDAYPIIDVDFNSKACFFQVTNHEGRTVLVGTPKDAIKEVVSATDILVNDNCDSSSTFTTISDTLLDNKVITGQYGVGMNGTAIVCTNYGTAQEGKWTGAAFKRNIGENLSEFEVTAQLTFSSQGTNYVAPPPSPPPAPPAPVPTPPAKPPTPAPTPPPVSLGTWKVVNCGGLYINSTASPANPLYPMAPGTLIYPTESNGNWFKHTHSNKWNTFTGWSSKSYLQKVSNSGKSKGVNTLDDEVVFADGQLGMIEIYGFDQNGVKLFKMEMSDTSGYYEYVDPKVYIGSSLVLHDGKNTPSPRQVNITDKDGKVTGNKSVASGVFGDFNDFEGSMSIKRQKNKAGTFLWTCEVRKVKDGKIVKTIATANDLSNSAYPKGNLNYIGVFIGRYGANEEVSVAALNHLTVKRLNMKTDDYPDKNVRIFEPGDHMQIDFEEGSVTLNNESILSRLDVGSDFFTIQPGSSQIAFRTDDEKAAVSVGFKDRFI